MDDSLKHIVAMTEECRGLALGPRVHFSEEEGVGSVSR